MKPLWMAINSRGDCEFNELFLTEIAGHFLRTLDELMGTGNSESARNHLFLGLVSDRVESGAIWGLTRGSAVCGMKVAMGHPLLC